MQGIKYIAVGDAGLKQNNIDQITQPVCSDYKL